MNRFDDFTPVFIVGSARSGTTILDKLLSAGPDFFEYNAETLLLDVCRMKYGKIFTCERKRSVFLKDWYSSRQFKRSNLSKDEFEKLLNKSNCYPELLIRFLRAMSLKAGKKYIVDSTPSNIFWIREIVSTCPNAIIIHVIRDGRDVAISQVKLGWSNPPGPFRDRVSLLHYAMVVWSYTQNLFEKRANLLLTKAVRFEDIVSEPKKTLLDIEAYIGIGLTNNDYSYVLANQRNTAFEDSDRSPIGRWREESSFSLSQFCFGSQKVLKRYGYPVIRCDNSIYSILRLVVFNMHIRLKRLVGRVHYVSKYSSQSLEID